MPANYLTITDTSDKAMRGRVIEARQLGRGSVLLNVETPEPLPTGEYTAVYATTWQETEGTYQVESATKAAPARWLSTGIFTRTKPHRRKW
jgi:hypothetical protein